MNVRSNLLHHTMVITLALPQPSDTEFANMSRKLQSLLESLPLWTFFTETPLLDKDLRSPSFSIKAWLHKLSSCASPNNSNSRTSENLLTSGASSSALTAHSYSLAAPSALFHGPSTESVNILPTNLPSLECPDLIQFDSLMLQSGSLTAEELRGVHLTSESPVAAAHFLVSVMAPGMAPSDA